MDYDGNGTNDQVFLITSDGMIKPALVDRDDGVLTIRFSPALCAGGASVFVGLVSRNAPGDVKASIGLSNGAGISVMARGPVPPPILCDFGPLLKAIGSISARDLTTSSDRSASGRRNVLLNSATAASAAALSGDLEEVLENVEKIGRKLSGDEASWITPEAAARIRTALLDLLNCLQQYNQTSGPIGENDDGDHDDGQP
jgi:hypothetical protein